MRKRSNYFVAACVLVAVSVACKKNKTGGDPADESQPVVNTDVYEPVVPQGWPNPYYSFQANDVSKSKFTLGRYLFYETMLSEDSTVSCGSCHQQVFAFSNGPDHKTSHGVHDLIGKRNSPVIFNLTWHTQLMWDGRSSNIENQPIGPIENPIEMNLQLGTAVSRLAYSTKYKQLFKEAFGDTVVNSQRMLKAFAQFMGLMVSNQSKYDKVKRGDDTFTASENAGYELYKSKCASCHVEPLFSDFKSRSNGLPPSGYQDSVVYNISFNTSDIYKFKTPSLRNLGFSAPYMHDGRFGALSEVLNHYAIGTTNKTNIDPLLMNGISLTEQEKTDIISFLGTLNDYVFINNERFKEIH